MVFSLAFTTIEIVNSQPALANSSAFLCKSSNGNLYGYQTEQTSNSLNVHRFDVETGETKLNVKNYSNLNGIGIRNFKDIKGSAMDENGKDLRKIKKIEKKQPDPDPTGEHSM